MVIFLKILALSTVLIRLFFVIYSLAHDGVVMKNLQYFLKLYTEKYKLNVDDKLLIQTIKAREKKGQIEVIILFIIVLLISII